MGLSLGQPRQMGTVGTKGAVATLLQLIAPVHNTCSEVSLPSLFKEARFLDFLVKYPKFCMLTVNPT